MTDNTTAKKITVPTPPERVPELARAHHRSIIAMREAGRRIVEGETPDAQETPRDIAAQALRDLLTTSLSANAILAAAQEAQDKAISAIVGAKGDGIGKAQAQARTAAAEVDRAHELVAVERTYREVAQRILDAESEDAWSAAVDDARLARESADRALGLEDAEREAAAAAADLLNAPPKDAPALAEVYEAATQARAKAIANDPLATLTVAVEALAAYGPALDAGTTTYVVPAPAIGAGQKLTVEQLDQLLPLLYEPLPESYVRLGKATNGGGRLVRMSTSQPVIDRLNAVFGPTHWTQLVADDSDPGTESRSRGELDAASIVHVVIGNNLDGLALSENGRALQCPEGAEAPEVLLHRWAVGRHSDRSATQARRGADTNGLKTVGALLGIGAAIAAAQIYDQGREQIDGEGPAADLEPAEGSNEFDLPDELLNLGESDYSRRIARSLWVMNIKAAKVLDEEGGGSAGQKRLARQFIEVFENQSGFGDLIDNQDGAEWDDPLTWVDVFRHNLTPPQRAKNYAELLDQAAEWFDNPKPFDQVVSEFPQLAAVMTVTKPTAAAG